jgi:hypothetical protein
MLTPKEWELLKKIAKKLNLELSTGSPTDAEGIKFGPDWRLGSLWYQPASDPRPWVRLGLSTYEWTDFIGALKYLANR